MNTQPLSGIHHVTAIAGNPQQNVDFYTEVLGLRLVKRTVNFDDPGTYHLYYGDEVGHPGTVLTFFPWPSGQKGQRGAGQATVTAFSVPSGALKYWIERFKRFSIPHQSPYTRFDEEVLTFHDPDGLLLELVADPAASQERAWRGGDVPAEHAVSGIFGVTLAEASNSQTDIFLGEMMVFRQAGETANRCRYEVGEGADKARIDLLLVPETPRSRVAVGTVHHIAFRTPNDASQIDWQQRLAGQSVQVTRVMDRQYFHSIYFREPGGILFEIATDAPGFTLDEPVERLGSDLKLPPWLEPQRAQIEQALPPLA